MSQKRCIFLTMVCVCSSVSQMLSLLHGIGLQSKCCPENPKLCTCPFADSDTIPPAAPGTHQLGIFLVHSEYCITSRGQSDPHTSLNYRSHMWSVFRRPQEHVSMHCLLDCVVLHQVYLLPRTLFPWWIMETSPPPQGRL